MVNFNEAKYGTEGIRRTIKVEPALIRPSRILVGRSHGITSDLVDLRARGVNHHRDRRTTLIPNCARRELAFSFVSTLARLPFRSFALQPIIKQCRETPDGRSGKYETARSEVMPPFSHRRPQPFVGYAESHRDNALHFALYYHTSVIILYRLFYFFLNKYFPSCFLGFAHFSLTKHFPRG